MLGMIVWTSRVLGRARWRRERESTLDAILGPPRRWAGDDAEVAPSALPVILVSSRDGVQVPPVRAVLAMTRLAEQHGWAVECTYALAAVPEQHYLNGKIKHVAHHLGSIALRVRRGQVAAYATWYQVDREGWRFASAWRGHRAYGARAFTAMLAADPIDVSGRPAGDEPAPAGSTEGGAARLTGAGPALIPGGAS